MSNIETRILGHRGWNEGCPENTCLAFREALKLGVEGIEFDVQLTRDGVPVIIHDPTVNRTTDGTGPVSGYSLRELRGLNAAARRPDAKKFGFHPIPTLEEVLQVVQRVQPRSLCNIEIKVYEGDGQSVVDTVLEHLKGHPLAGNIQFSSFHHDCLAYLRSRSKRAQIGLLYEEMPLDPWKRAAEIGASHVNLSHKIATPALLHTCSAHGLKICVWTVDDVREIQSFFDAGIDILITNAPDRALKVRQGV